MRPPLRTVVRVRQSSSFGLVRPRASAPRLCRMNWDAALAMAERLWQRFPRRGYLAVRVLLVVHEVRATWRDTADREVIAWSLASAAANGCVCGECDV